MSLWNEVPTSLTSFAPLTSDVQASGNFLSRFFKRGKEDSDQSSTEGSEASSRDVSVERGAPRELSVDRQAYGEEPVARIGHTGDRNAADEKENFSPDSVSDVEKPGTSEASTRRMSVVARLTDILNRRTATPQVYRDSDFKQYWMPDSSCKECYNCNDKFTTFRRRHHCRICGQIFCNTCCNKELPGKIIGYKGSIRVCDYCYQIVNSYAQKANPTGDPRVTTEVLHEIQSETTIPTDQGGKSQKRSNYDLHRSLSLRSPSDFELNNDGIAPFDRTPQSEYVMSLNFPRERRLLLQDSIELRNLYTLMMEPDNGVEFDNYRVRLRNSHRVIAGNKLVDWLLKHDKVATRVQGVAVGQALIDAEYLDPLHNITTPFRDDFTLYRPPEVVAIDNVTPDNDPLDVSVSEDSAPLWFQQIKANTHPDDQSGDLHGHFSQDEYLQQQHSSVYSELSEDSTGAIKVDEQHFDEPLHSQATMATEDIAESMFEGDVNTSEQPMVELGGWRNLSMNTDDAEQKEVFNKLQQEHHDHLTQLTRQLLAEDHLPLGWADIIISTVDRVALFVQPDVKHSSDEMDIRKYVHIKKIPGGSREQTGLIHGVIFKKNVANRKMPQSISKPNVLLLYGSIEYQRVENKMSMLEPLISQEREFLKKNIAKIVDLKQKPDILVVEKSVANIAQKFLLDEGITLINNVKLSVMKRLSRFLDTDIVTSIDSLVRGVHLGFCHTFSVQSFSLPAGEMKTMVSFSGCATHLGCAVKLRGGLNRELNKVKKIMKFMLFASYHSRLEISFCVDECMTPSRTQDFDLDQEDVVLGRKETKHCQENPSEKETNYESSELKDKIQPDKLPFTEGEDIRLSDDTYVYNKDTCSGFESFLATEQSGEFNTTAVVVTESVATGVKGASVLQETVISDKTNNGMMKEVDITQLEEVMVYLEGEPGICQEGLTKASDPIGPGTTMFIKKERMSSFMQLESDTGGGQKSEPEQTVIQTNQENMEVQILKEDKYEHNETDNSESAMIHFYIPDQNISSDTQALYLDSENVTTKPEAVTCEDVNVFEKLTQTPANSTKLTSQSMPVLRVREKSGQKSGKDRSPNLHRKSEVKQLTDKSDPLHNYQLSQDESIFQSSLALQEQMLTHRHKFRKALDNVVLCISPFIKYDLPYLETDSGAKCELRRFFSEEIYWSHTFSPKVSKKQRHTRQKSDYSKKSEVCPGVNIKDAHVFIQSQMVLPAYDISTQHLIASFRAYGGRLNIVDRHLSTRLTSLAAGTQDKGTGESIKEGMWQEGGPVSDRKVDCLDPFRHQRIAVLFSSFSYLSENHPSPCVNPWIVIMEFYGKNDITLGGFLERFCFRPSYVCPSDSCNTSMDQHIRRFVHRTGSISVILKRHSQPIQSEQERILMWSWCYKCKQVTKIMPMSINTWNMSFAKYLELRFHGNTFQRMDHAKCHHSLHHDHYQYFGFQETVASFRFCPIKVKEIQLPPLVIEHSAQLEVMMLYRLKEEVKALSAKILKMFSMSLEYLTSMKTDSCCDVVSPAISEYIQQQQVEKTNLQDMAYCTREKLDILLKAAETSKVITLSQVEKQMVEEVEDSIVLMKKCMTEMVTNWNLKFQDLYVTQKKANRSSQNQRKEKDAMSVASTVTMEAEERDGKGSSSLPNLDGTELSPVLMDGLSTEVDGTELSPGLMDGNSTEDSPASLMEEASSVSDIDISDTHHKSDFTFMDVSPPPLSEVKSLTSVDSYLYGVTPDGLPDSLENTGSERSGTFDDESAGPQEQPCDCQSVLVSTKAEGREEEEGKADEEEKGGKNVKGVKDKLSVTESATRKYSGDDVSDGQVDNAGGLRKKLINTIWQGSGASQLPMPFDACEHHLLSKCHRLPVVVYDHEPSSIIAYALSSVDYNSKLLEVQTVLAQSFRSSKTETDLFEQNVKEEGGAISKKPSSSKLSFFKGSGKEMVQKPDTPPDTVRYVARSDSSSLESPEEADYSVLTASISEAAEKSKSGKPTPNMHIETQFADQTARFYCKVYFAEQFRQLRKLIYPEGEDNFIRSLSRCKPWEAKGGKSGSTFCKTDDDRFILKQMSSMEVESFEKFGPQYFQYISETKQQQHPTALAKIVGVYRIGFRNQQTNNAMKQDLLIVENLFYNRNISQTFDLKGSERNRLVKNTRSKRDEELVLLDENFLRDSVDNPLYIMPHSKRILRQAINRDSQFLSTNFVMDYSLLVGLDETRKELVIGVIDYIRTFTWDKKLETIFKSNFGGQGKMPTVVSPELYRTRFLEAMARYFLAVPDQWNGLGCDVEL